MGLILFREISLLIKHISSEMLKEPPTNGNSEINILSKKITPSAAVENLATNLIEMEATVRPDLMMGTSG